MQQAMRLSGPLPPLPGFQRKRQLRFGRVRLDLGKLVLGTRKAPRTSLFLESSFQENFRLALADSHLRTLSLWAMIEIMERTLLVIEHDDDGSVERSV